MQNKIKREAQAKILISLWIDVDKDLPKDGGFVLVSLSYEGEKGNNMVTMGIYENEKWTNALCSKDEKWKVTHWIEFPFFKDLI